MRYRADIGGLRALAVLPVVLYHLDERLVPGGYVGVDIFFVISGYLITKLLAQDLEAQRFSLLTFYDRRVRRIVPAYAAVALATSVAALILLPPGMLVAFGKSLQAASTFFANRYFLSATGYFGAAPDEQWLLHTWSLSVEEQFYLAWPLLLALLFHPRLARIRPYVIWALVIASLVVSTRNAVLRPGPAFYNSLGRFWELLLGSVLALGYLPRLRTIFQAEGVALVGLGLIGFAYASFGHGTIFPGATALVPTVGALCLIWAGEDGRTTWVGRLLALAPLVWIGLISYSLYLWHWPIIAIHRFLTFRSPELVEGIGLFAAMLVLSALSWRFVEAPFRRHGPAQAASEWRSVGVGIAVLAGLTGLGWVMVATGGLPGRATAAYLQAEQTVGTYWKGRASCLLGPGGTMPPEGQCRFGDPDSRAPVVALWGDSFGDHHGPALDRLGQEEGFGFWQVTKAGCAPLAPDPAMSPLARSEQQACNAFRAQSLARLIADPQVRLVVIAGNWANDPPADRARLAAALDAFSAAGKPVLLVGSAGGFSTGGGRCVLRRRFAGNDETVCNVTRSASDADASALESWLQGLADEKPGRSLFRPRLLYCDDSTCRPTADGVPLFLDGGHLNVAGALHALEAWRAVLVPPLKTPAPPVR
ncbi:acyltransferase family protein [Aquabacter sp. P-9]|nr:acyltransferase family protein [Aquabacter sp. P-9]MDE1567929.1 acyltransferase family protein [Aquabacter sp. P-9]